MKRISDFFYGTGSLLKRVCDKIARTIYTRPATNKDLAWNEFCQAGGEQIRFEYPSLDSNAIVFDLGGYEGQWASDIYGRYQSKIYVFEVYIPYFNNIKERFLHNDDILVYDFGLAATDATAQISIDGYSTSAFKKSENMATIRLKKAADFITENKVSHIHLMKINIEGAEYELLAHLIDTGLVKTIDNLQIQFHDFIPDALNEMNRIREKLSETHYPTYQFDFIWDNWKLKD